MKNLIAFNQIYDANSITIESFRNFPLVLPRLEELKAWHALVKTDNYSLEFGVYSGTSIRELAFAYTKKEFFGFDSFKGLPEDWKRSDQDTYKAGHFSLKGHPPVPKNVSLITGFFEESLEPWLSDHTDPIGFVHIDPDLYSAAKFILTSLTKRLADGAIIVFDELCDWGNSGVYPLWEEGEWRALKEWLEETGFYFRILSRSARFEAAIQIYKSKPRNLISQDILERANALWGADAKAEAVNVLKEKTIDKPEWVNAHYILASWYSKLKKPENALRIVERIWPKAKLIPDHNHTLELQRLRADSNYRLNNLESATKDIREFLTKRPNHIGGLALGARIETSNCEHKQAYSFWLRAYKISGKRKYFEEAETSKILTEIKPAFREMKFSSLMIQHLVESREFTTVLDIGSGSGEQSKALRAYGKIVTELDYGESKYFNLRPHEGNVIVGNIMEVEIDRTFDCVIASHVLEHQLNINNFLKKVHSLLNEGGVIGISVPPLKKNIVGGHVSLWNAGLLLYNLVLAGFDCSEPWIRAYGYNISIVIKKRSITLENLEYDSGDINRIAHYLPKDFKEGFNGDIKKLN